MPKSKCLATKTFPRQRVFWHRRHRECGGIQSEYQVNTRAARERTSRGSPRPAWRRYRPPFCPSTCPAPPRAPITLQATGGDIRHRKSGRIGFRCTRHHVQSTKGHPPMSVSYACAPGDMQRVWAPLASGLRRARPAWTTACEAGRVRKGTRTTLSDVPGRVT
jgi:hypothetical protein